MVVHPARRRVRGAWGRVKGALVPALRASAAPTARPRQAVKVAGDRVVDRWLRVETADVVLADDLGYAADGQDEGYEATNWAALLWLAAYLRRLRPGPRDAFMDYGAGKGRVLLLSARLPFGRVTGVELSPALARLAEQNIAENRGRLRARHVSVVQGDMATVPVPDDVTVAYFYNPSRGPALRGAIEQIRASLERRPRQFRLVYVNPQMHETLVDAGFRVVHRVPFAAWRVYAYGA